MLHDVDFGSSSISNKSGTDSPSVVIACNSRIEYDRFSDPLSEVVTTYLYDFIKEACSKLHDSCAVELKMIATQEYKHSGHVDVISCDDYHDRILKQSLTSMIFCSKKYIGLKVLDLPICAPN